MATTPEQLEAQLENHPNDSIGQLERWTRMRAQWRKVLIAIVVHLIACVLMLAILPAICTIVFGLVAMNGFQTHRTGRLWWLWGYWMVEYAVITGVFIYVTFSSNVSYPWWVLIAYVGMATVLAVSMRCVRHLITQIQAYKALYGNIVESHVPRYPSQAMMTTTTAVVQPQATSVPMQMLPAGGAHAVPHHPHQPHIYAVPQERGHTYHVYPHGAAGAGTGVAAAGPTVPYPGAVPVGYTPMYAQAAPAPVHTPYPGASLYPTV